MTRLLAIEDPNGFYLNWAPGPMPTRMFEYMKSTVVEDPDSTQDEVDLWNNMELVDLEKSASVLYQVLISEKRQQFNGKHVDYFDVDMEKL